MHKTSFTIRGIRLVIGVMSSVMYRLYMHVSTLLLELNSLVQLHSLIFILIVLISYTDMRALQLKSGPESLCIVNFINNGVTQMNSGQVMIEFRGSGSIQSGYLCSLNKAELSPCK